MSNAVSSLGGQTAEGDVTVSDAGLRGMVTLRGDLSNATLQDTCATLTGAAFPAPNTATRNGTGGLCWMSPDEVLLLLPHAAARAACATLDQALQGQHHLATNVSDARALISLTGPDVREVLAKLTPVDLHPQAFAVGDFRRSKLGQVAAAFWLTDDTTAQVICFRSVASYVFDLLATSAQAGPVGHLAQG